MTERRQWWRIALLTVFVLAVHLWLLAGMPRLVIPAHSPAPLAVRTVTPPTPAPEPAPAAPPEKAAQPPAIAKAARTSPALPPPSPKIAPPTDAPRAVASSARSAPSSAPAASAKPEPASTHAAAAARESHVLVPGSARFHYDVIAQGKGLTLHGSALLDWRNDGHTYEADLSMTSPIPFVRARTQHSSGLVTASGLAPVRFSDKVRSEEATHFDRENNRIVFSTNKPEAPLEPGVQDRLSIVLQLASMLAGDPSKYPAGTAISVQTASTKEAEPWTFTVAGEETLDLPGGRVAAVRLTRNPRREYDVKVELWLAPGAAYAPVRLRLTQPNGDWVDQQWSSTDRG